MSSSALELHLLNITSKLNAYTLESMCMSDDQEANQKKLSKQVKYEEAWNKEYDKALDEDKSSDLVMCGKTFIAKKTAGTELQAEQWAIYKVAEYDAELSLELADLDMDYDSTITMINTLMEKLNADKESVKQQLATEVSDTHELNQ
ncbi:MAG: hypothetical protein E7Z89_07815 [Cyanobacteria bacterium SIG28]|nr:hypothetical protein [Cyanobacteria bacterium SIG28]